MSSHNFEIDKAASIVLMRLEEMEQLKGSIVEKQKKLKAYEKYVNQAINDLLSLARCHRHD